MTYLGYATIVAGAAAVTRPLHAATPLVRSAGLSRSLGREIYFKLDCLQEPGSFKLRGIGRVVQAAKEKGAKGVVSSSGGNAGIATAFAAQRLGLDCTVVLPSSTPSSVRATLEEIYCATVVVRGAVWDEANVEAERISRDSQSPLVHPFDDPIAWDGHASMVEEIVADLGRHPDCIVVSVGGGGLLMGTLLGVERHAPQTHRIVAVETQGADSFARSFQAGCPVALPGGITSIAKSLGATTPSPTILRKALDSKNIVTTKVVSDADALRACLAFANERRFLVEPACGASLATVYDPRHADDVFDDHCRTVVIQVCGGAVVDFSMLRAWLENHHVVN
ncbi:hypothetical protein CTAYLR_001033 [Chrysophaeum taylorii]|uniref:L-serine ammonia-lyase n=1 Tax=Chrysophaeum taylorii TaxID=2483200 RepID=A0AAD7XQ69_9STRA|nr:hypothetical protein CTAYLR_001033 [Chrysophaeum taylorii]